MISRIHLDNHSTMNMHHNATATQLSHVILTNALAAVGFEFYPLAGLELRHHNVVVHGSHALCCVRESSVNAIIRVNMCENAHVRMRTTNSIYYTIECLCAMTNARW